MRKQKNAHTKRGIRRTSYIIKVSVQCSTLSGTMRCVRRCLVDISHDRCGTTMVLAGEFGLLTLPQHNTVLGWRRRESCTPSCCKITAPLKKIPASLAAYQLSGDSRDIEIRRKPAPMYRQYINMIPSNETRLEVDGLLPKKFHSGGLCSLIFQTINSRSPPIATVGWQ